MNEAERQEAFKNSADMDGEQVTDADSKRLEEIKTGLAENKATRLYQYNQTERLWLEETLTQLESAQAELNLVADCLEGNAPMHLAFVDHPHAHNARALQSQLTAERAKITQKHCQSCGCHDPSADTEEKK